MAIALSVIHLAVFVFYLALILRIAFDMIRSYAPVYRPSGLALVAFESVYTITDWAVKPLRALLPPVRLGAVALDLSILIAFIASMLVMNLLAPFVI